MELKTIIGYQYKNKQVAQPELKRTFVFFDGCVPEPVASPNTQELLCLSSSQCQQDSL